MGGERLSLVELFDLGSDPAEPPALVPWGTLDAKAVVVEEGLEGAVLDIGLPADSEAQDVGEFGFGETVLDGREKLGSR